MAYGQVNVDKTVNSDGTITGGLYGFKNRVINGAMMIDQRNAGASVTITADGQFGADRWKFSQSQNSKFTYQRSTTAPAGFTNSSLVTVANAVTPSGSDYFGLYQVIEGYNVADLGFGSASAQAITISFWVRSSLTGTFSGMAFNAAANRSYCFTYTINSANTFEQKTITIAGDQSGTWATDNSAGLSLYFDLGSGTNTGTAGSWQSTIVRRTSGSVQLVATTGATFYITGVQLEKGSTATSFDYRPYGTELALCQRYCSVDGYALSGVLYGMLGTGFNGSTTSSNFNYFLPVTMRAVPSCSWTGAWSDLPSGATGTAITLNGPRSTTRNLLLTGTVSSGAVVTNAVSFLNANNSTTWQLKLEAEL